MTRELASPAGELGLRGDLDITYQTQQRDMFASGLAASIGVNAFAVWHAIKSHADFQTGECWPGIRRLMELTGLSTDPTQAAIKKLKAFHLLRVNKRGRRNHYVARERMDVRIGKRVICTVVSSEDGQTRVLKGFEHLLQSTYPNLRMLRDVAFNEADIGKHLRMMDDGLIANDATSMTEPEQELLAFIQGNARGGVRTTVKSLIERFERKNYGWYYAAILCNLALLCARGRVEVRQDSNSLERDALERSLRNTNAHASLVLEPQVEFSASQVRALKDFYADFFDKPASSNEARALARETIDALKELEIELATLHGQKAQLPFLSVLTPVLATLKDIASKNLNWFLTELTRAEDALLDTKENILDPLRRFMNSPQRAIFEQARALVAEQEDNFAYVAASEVDAFRGLLADSKPWQGNRLQQLKPQLDALEQAIAQQLAIERDAAAHRLAGSSSSTCCCSIAACAAW
jgi:hypothetical protein